ncbi:hypothetical protein LAZ40_04895 [Cereibacter sphaeroides]|uniref:plasmid replication protein RepC n=1 Tax=Cereibacter sphaeroides TaxID=1063 RepID=UPI001EEEFD71|nr:plasmid replication protein RepC [Cereibacter sphaeroides]MCE6958393.1 hypothetical protein [Cereibacter sphaeroides]MCE6972260.1 hypothetical protein [Cereibacter sphaeroides]
MGDGPPRRAKMKHFRDMERTPEGEPTDGGAPVAKAHQDRWFLLDVVSKLAPRLGLKAAHVAVLRALLTFPHEAEGRSIVFPSNRSLCERANGLHERSLSRHIRRLVEARLIERRDSANFRRKAHRSAEGEVLVAYGFDLAPLYRRRDELVDELARQGEERRRIAMLRDCLGKRRRQLEDEDRTPELRERIRLALRRVPVADQLAALLDEADALFAEAPCPAVPEEMSAAVGQNGRHLQESGERTPDSDSRKADCVAPGCAAAKSTEDETSPNGRDATRNRPSPADLLNACPAVAWIAEDAPPRTWMDMIRFGWTVALNIGISRDQVEEAHRTLGAEDATITLLCIGQRLGQIRRPGAYLRALCRKAGRFSAHRLYRQTLALGDRTGAFA